MNGIKNRNLRFFSLAILFSCVFGTLSSANENVRTIKFSDVDGLPRNIVTCFQLDKYGYGWVGTGNGIARFDGYHFVQYESLKGRTINNLVLDELNQLWVGSDRGLFLYNRLEDEFKLIQSGYINQLSINNGQLYYLLVNKIIKLNSVHDTTEYSIEGINAYAVTNQGIWYNAGNTGIINLKNGEQYLNDRVVSFIRQIDQNIWIACRNGDLFVKDGLGNIRRIHIENRHNIMDIEKINDQIWISTDGNGIFMLDKHYNLMVQYKKNNNEIINLPSNSIYDVSKGLNNTIWISTYGAGLICIVQENNAFVNITPEPGRENSLVDKEGISVFVDNDTYYFGTNYGLSVWDKNKNIFRNIAEEEIKKQLKGSKITAIYTENHDLWIATYDGLLGRYSKNLQLKKTYSPCTENNTEMQRIILMHALAENKFLVGTQFRDKRLLVFNTKPEQFQPVLLESGNQLRNNFQINTIRKNQFGETVALVRNGGIYVFNEKTNILENSFPEINNRITFKLNDFYHDKDGNYWFTTQADGLIKLSPDGRIFDKWTVELGFPTNSLLRIESLNDKVLWISTIDGLCRFERETGQLQIFNYRHGLVSNEFLPRVSAITTDNKIIFGNSEGFTLVDPAKLLPDTSKSEVVISDITFLNQSIKNKANEKLLQIPLEESQTLKLPYNKNSFTLSFFTRDNYLPKFNNFEYRLLGLEDEWIYLGENNKTTYTSLSPGNYVFQVRSTNKSNIWNENATNLEIKIMPPWYLTWIAFIAYGVFIILNIVLIFRIYAKRIQLKKEIEISEFKIQNEHELTEKKLAFFTNISHDLKTPLTLISAPVNDLLQSENLNEDQIRKLDVVKRNAARLYKLISDLIDFRKLTQKQLPLQVCPTDLQPVIVNIFKAFSLECQKRDIDFTYQNLLSENVYVDVKKIEKMLWNLIANAIKFTPDSGKIWLKTEVFFKKNEKFLKMEVGDTGKGFSEKEKLRIFDRFYQINKSENLNFDGSGIGLSIVNDLVGIHRGEISVESAPGKGTVFSIIIPAEEQHYSNNELLADVTPPSKNESDEIYSKHKVLNEDVLPEKKYSLPKILIVEDNIELADYLISHFASSYKVYKAENGKKGLELARKKEPDLVITDVQMPEIDGIDFCKLLRENYTLSHTPVIMLTANSTTEKKVEGLKAGADSYVTKPFEIEYLDAVAQSLLANRKRAKEKFLGIEPVNDELEAYSKNDIEFINELKNFIFQNITNENLNIDLLAKHFTISRTQLNRRIKALTNSTPNNYIRTIRLKKAYELIKKQHIRVSEAAYATGFADPNYFTFCFKKEFGENPSRI